MGLRLQRGCGVRGWGPAGLGTGAGARRAFMLTTLELLANDVADFFRPFRGEF